VSAPAPKTVVLFLSGDPVLAERLAAQPATYAGFSRFFVSGALASGLGGPKAPKRRSGDAGRAFPPGQVMCAQRLTDVAKRMGRTVKIVDVNDPGGDAGLVAQYIGSGDVLPVAVRSDGERLEGEEAFDTANLRRFLAVP